MTCLSVYEQACDTSVDGERKYRIIFKILQADGRFMNLYIANHHNAQCDIDGKGTWSIEDGCLVESIETNSRNLFRGQNNSMKLTLSDNGDLMHIVWTNAITGTSMHEYYEKVK